MQDNLVIVESPTKAKTISRFLGENFTVMSSQGHIRDLKSKAFSINTDTFEPEYEIPEDKEKIVESLRKAAKKSSCVWLASDEDREGEAISWHLAEVLGLDVENTRRIVFHEITQSAIQTAIKNPRNIDLSLVNAQQARRVLDRIVGFKLSPVLWRKVKPGLSAGRVQSVAVRLIADKEQEIKQFTPKVFYAVSACLKVENPNSKVATEVVASLNRRFESKQGAYDFLLCCVGKTFSVSDLQKKPVVRTPAPPFMTSTLQQEAARKLGYPVSLTMRIAQQLYEAGHITYMRTDSLNLSTLCTESCKQYIRETMGAPYSKPRRFQTKAKGAQEAHEAIRPTFMDKETLENGTLQEKRLYQLIWKRTLASQMADATFERTIVTIDVEDKEEKFEVTGETVTFDGFLKVYHESTDESNGENELKLLPPMRKGMDLMLVSMNAHQHFSQRPGRYNEASLVHKMEELGIGRPSTYAPIISTIQQRGYVERRNKEGEKRDVIELVLVHNEIQEKVWTEVFGSEKNKLFPTDVGMVVNDYLMEEFPGIMEYNFTANIEKEFDLVAEGKKEWTNLMKSFYTDFVPEVEKAIHTKSELKVGERILGKDPKTGKQISVKIGPFGPMAQLGATSDNEKPSFAPLIKGQSIDSITLEEVLKLFQLPRQLGEYEGKSVVVNNGRFGPYVRFDKVYVSIPKTIDFMSIQLEEAIELVKKKKEAEAASHLKKFDEDPEMEIRTGRFGPYISYKGSNYHIPKNLAENAVALTVQQCKEIIENQPKSKSRSKKTKK